MVLNLSEDPLLLLTKMFANHSDLKINDYDFVNLVTFAKSTHFSYIAEHLCQMNSVRNSKPILSVQKNEPLWRLIDTSTMLLLVIEMAEAFSLVLLEILQLQAASSR